jgi:hypothetical protein
VGNILLANVPLVKQRLVHLSSGKSPPDKPHCSIERRLEIVQVMIVSRLLDDTMDRKISVVLPNESLVEQFCDSGLELRRRIDKVRKSDYIPFVDVFCILFAKF